MEREREREREKKNNVFNDLQMKCMLFPQEPRTNTEEPAK